MNMVILRLSVSTDQLPVIDITDMQSMHDQARKHFTEHDALIRTWADVVISALTKSNMTYTTDAVIYYGLFKRGVSVDDAAKVLEYLGNDSRIERSGVLIKIL